MIQSTLLWALIGLTHISAFTHEYDHQNDAVLARRPFTQGQHSWRHLQRQGDQIKRAERSSQGLKFPLNFLPRSKYKRVLTNARGATFSRRVRHGNSAGAHTCNKIKRGAIDPGRQVQRKRYTRAHRKRNNVSHSNESSKSLPTIINLIKNNDNSDICGCAHFKNDSIIRSNTVHMPNGVPVMSCTENSCKFHTTSELSIDYFSTTPRRCLPKSTTTPKPPPTTPTSTKSWCSTPTARCTTTPRLPPKTCSPPTMSCQKLPTTCPCNAHRNSQYYQNNQHSNGCPKGASICQNARIICEAAVNLCEQAHSLCQDRGGRCQHPSNVDQNYPSVPRHEPQNPVRCLCPNVGTTSPPTCTSRTTTTLCTNPPSNPKVNKDFLRNVDTKALHRTPGIRVLPCGHECVNSANASTAPGRLPICCPLHCATCSKNLTPFGPRGGTQPIVVKRNLFDPRRLRKVRRKRRHKMGYGLPKKLTISNYWRR